MYEKVNIMIVNVIVHVLDSHYESTVKSEIGLSECTFTT
jgi:hypothetical protein